MALPWELRRRGLKDSLRHDQRVKEAIRKNLRELIAEEAIITSDGHKRVRIPVRYLEQYRFKYGHPQPGVGQGQGQPGDALGRRPGDGKAPGEGPPGEQPGEHTYEVEVPARGAHPDDARRPRLALDGRETGAADPHHQLSFHGHSATRLDVKSRQAPHPAHQPQAQCGTWSCRSGRTARCRPALQSMGHTRGDPCQRGGLHAHGL